LVNAPRLEADFVKALVERRRCGILKDDSLQLVYSVVASLVRLGFVLASNMVKRQAALRGHQCRLKRMAVFCGYTLTAPAGCCMIKLFEDMEGRFFQPHWDSQLPKRLSPQTGAKHSKQVFGEATKNRKMVKSNTFICLLCMLVPDVYSITGMQTSSSHCLRNAGHIAALNARLRYIIDNTSKVYVSGAKTEAGTSCLQMKQVSDDPTRLMIVVGWLYACTLQHTHQAWPITVSLNSVSRSH